MNMQDDINVGLMTGGKHLYPPCESKSGKREICIKVLVYKEWLDLCDGKTTEELRGSGGGKLLY